MPTRLLLFLLGVFFILWGINNNLGAMAAAIIAPQGLIEHGASGNFSSNTANV